MAGVRHHARTWAKGYFDFALAHPLFLGFGFALTFFSSFGQTYFISTFKDAISAEFGLSATAWGLRYGIATGASALSFIWIGRLIDDWDLRRWTIGVVLLLTLACALMAFTPSAMFLVLSLFAMRLAGQALMGHTAMTSMARYFDAERGRALTLSGLGFALGFAIGPSIGVQLEAQLPWRDAWLWIGGVVLAIVLPVAVFLLRGHAARHAAWLARQKADDDVDVLDGVRRTRQWTRGEVLGDWRFYLLVPGTLACAFLMTGMIMFHSDLAAAKGWTMEYISTAMVAVGITLYLTSIVLGPIVDRVGARRLVVFTQVPLGLGMLVIATWDAPAAAWLYLALAGMTMGSMGPVVGSVWAEMYGTRHLGAIRALTGACMAMSTAASPFLFGRLIDAGVGMRDIAWGSFVFVIISTLLMVPAVRARAPADA